MTIVDELKATVEGPWPNENTRTDTEFRLDDNNGELRITFQGSSSKLDWAQNFSFGVRPYRNMREPWYAHHGFVKKYNSVRDHILNAVRNYEPEKIALRGFSQGAALATLCHEDLGFHFPLAEVHTIVFGSPRVLWLPKTNKLNEFKDLLNVQNGNDAVTKLPPKLFGFMHVGHVLHIGDDVQFLKYNVRDHIPTQYKINLIKL